MLLPIQIAYSSAGAWEIKGANKKGHLFPFAGFHFVRQEFSRVNMLKLTDLTITLLLIQALLN